LLLTFELFEEDALVELEELLVLLELLLFVVLDALELLLAADELLVDAFNTRIISNVMFVLLVPLVAFEPLKGTVGSAGRVELSSWPER
jgi:hypothetical protein